MKKINICGKRGLGDIVSGTSLMLKTINSDARLTYWLPAGFDYKRTLNVIIYQYSAKYPHKIELEVNEGWATVNYEKAVEKFGKSNFNQSWFFLSCYKDCYLPFKDNWEKNSDGPIGLSLNNENCNPSYPFQFKWFNKNVNRELVKLVDDKNYFSLGRPRTLEENIEIMKKCRYVLGVENGLTHIANAMRVPFIISKNRFDMAVLNSHHSMHPCLKIVEEYEIFKYLTL